MTYLRVMSERVMIRGIEGPLKRLMDKVSIENIETQCSNVSASRFLSFIRNKISLSRCFRSKDAFEDSLDFCHTKLWLILKIRTIIVYLQSGNPRYGFLFESIFFFSDKYIYITRFFNSSQEHLNKWLNDDWYIETTRQLDEVLEQPAKYKIFKSPHEDVFLL